jgi:hypothetical protein
MAEATRFITRTSGTAPYGGVHFLGEFSIAVGAFAPS